ncbi:hypothetical protein HZB02_01020 [Candidatus Woesearchaeota archaeon]|nr:hypothetical protein [Candidatus Woesearchaeota archaeon]
MKTMKKEKATTLAQARRGCSLRETEQPAKRASAAKGVVAIYTKKHSRKSQIELMETVGVLVIFFFLVVGGIIFWSWYEQNSLQDFAAESVQLKSISHMLSLTFLPELECTKGGVHEANCIDLMRLQKFKEKIDAADDRTFLSYYQQVLKSSKIVIQYVDAGAGHSIKPKPFTSSIDSITLYDIHPPDASSYVSSIPVALYDPVKETYYFGILEVTYYY